MRLFVRLYLAPLVALVFPVVAGAQSVEIVYPEEIFPELAPLLEAASKNAPELRVRRAQIEEREGQAISRGAERNSSLRLHSRMMGGYEQRFYINEDNAPQDRQDGRPVATVDASLWWEKPIFAWGNFERYARYGELGVEAAELDLAEAVRVQLNEVRATFLRWQMAEQQLRILEENVGVATQIVEAQRQLFDAGRVSEQRFLELEARLLETEESRAFFARERQYFRARLVGLVGDESLVAAVGVVEVPDFSLPEGATEADWITVLQSQGSSRPGVERERRYAQQDATWAEIVDKNQRPTVDLVAGLVSNRLDSADISNTTLRVVGYVGLQIRWNIFDGRRSEGERMAALARKRAREARLAAAEATIYDQGARLVADLRYQRAQADARTQRAELLARRLELATRPSAEDRISALDLLELRLDYLRAEQRILESKANFLMTMTQLAALVFQDPVAGL